MAVYTVPYIQRINTVWDHWSQTEFSDAKLRVLEQRSYSGRSHPALPLTLSNKLCTKRMLTYGLPTRGNPLLIA